MIRRDELHVFLRGGLGNQLFQYGTGLYIAAEHRKKLVIRPDLLPLKEDKIGGVSRWPNQISSFRHSGEIRATGNQPESATNAFGKYMQAMRFFGDMVPTLSRAFGHIAGESSSQIPLNPQRVRLINSYSPFKSLMWKIREQLSNEVSQIEQPSLAFLRLQERMLEENPIVVHLRQGDYKNLESIYGSLTPKYLSQGIESIRGKSGPECVWLFTDSHISKGSPYLESSNPTLIVGQELSALETLVLMGRGAGLVASNSSFSWWAAFLMNPALPVVAPFISTAITNNFDRQTERFGDWTLIDI